MIKVKDILLSSEYSVDFIYAEIVLEDTFENLSDYAFYLLKANSINGPYVVISSDMPDFSFRDYDVNLSNSHIKYYYKVRAINSSSGEEYLSEPYMLDVGPTDDITFYISSVYDTYLDVVVGNEPMKVMNRMHTGQLCDQCYDDVRGRSQDSSCPLCHGAGYVGGYYPPKDIMVSYAGPETEEQEATPSGIADKKSPNSLWAPAFPPVRNEDILVDSNNLRYVVAGVQISKKKFRPIRQLLRVVPIPKSSPVYQIPVGW